MLMVHILICIFLLSSSVLCGRNGWRSLDYFRIFPFNGPCESAKKACLTFVEEVSPHKEFFCGFPANWLFSQKLSLTCLIYRDIQKNIAWTTLYVRKALPERKSREQQFSLLVHEHSYEMKPFHGFVQFFSRNNTIHFVSLTLHLYELTIIKIQSRIIEYFRLEGRSYSPTSCSKQGHVRSDHTFQNFFQSGLGNIWGCRLQPPHCTACCNAGLSSLVKMFLLTSSQNLSFQLNAHCRLSYCQAPLWRASSISLMNPV